MNTTPNETTGTPDLTCPKCEGCGFISGLAGCSGYGDPEEEFVTEECSCFAGTLRCGGCGKEEAVAIVADGTAEGMPLGARCQRESGDAKAWCGDTDSGHVVDCTSRACAFCGKPMRTIDDLAPARGAA